jgi:hypothetical protein
LSGLVDQCDNGAGDYQAPEYGIDPGVVDQSIEPVDKKGHQTEQHGKNQA